MRLTVTLVLIAAVSCSYGHYVYLPVAGQDQFLTPAYHYVIHHPQSLLPPFVAQHPVGPPVVPDQPPILVHHPADDRPVSRETLEEHDDENNVQDISDEQAQLNPDDTQFHQKPELPSLPRPHPTPRPYPIPSPHIPSHPHPTPRPYPTPIPHIPSLPPFIPPSYPQVPSYPSPYQPPDGEVPNIVFNGPQPDGSYDFSYDLGDQSRSEKSDADGNVQGTYTYTGADGKKVTITYTAGAHKGFIPEGEGLLPPPPADCEGEGDDTNVPHIPQEPQRPYIPEEDDQQHIPPVIPPTRPPTKNPHDGGDDQGGEDEGGQEEGGHKGMPYNYNYDAGLSSKTETADDNGHVQGSYTYVDGAGVTRTVKYTVNGDEGFIATGDIHPDPGTAGEESNIHGISTTARPLHPGGHGTKTPNYPPPVTKGHGTNTPNYPPPGTKGGHGTKTPNHPPVKGVKTNGAGWDKYPLGG